MCVEFILQIVDQLFLNGGMYERLYRSASE